MKRSASSAVWRVGRNRVLPLDEPRIMGILNVTPDSFSDGGRYSSVAAAAGAAMKMVEEGACIIDVGGESTRPGASSVEAPEQIRRTLPVIENLRAGCDRNRLLISIDTTCSGVAASALDAGADIINDISAGRDDQAMLDLAASRGCGVILMHRRTRPARDSYSDQHAQAPDYGGDVVAFVRQFLAERIDAALAAGVHAESIVIDPGLGFGKSVDQNLELIARTGELATLGCPVLSAASRKSFIGAVTGQTDPVARTGGSIAVSVMHWMAGARLFRVHDVAAHRDALAMAAAIPDITSGASIEELPI